MWLSVGAGQGAGAKNLSWVVPRGLSGAALVSYESRRHWPSGLSGLACFSSPATAGCVFSGAGTELDNHILALLFTDTLTTNQTRPSLCGAPRASVPLLGRPR